MLDPRRSPAAASGRLLVLAVLALAPFAPVRAAHAGAATLPTGFVDDPVVAPLNEPVGLAEIPDPFTITNRRVLYVEQRTAVVGLVVGGAATPLATIPGVSGIESERGLLGIAVDPRFPQRPYVYVHSTDDVGSHVIDISRFTLTGDLDFSGDGQLQLDPASRRDVLTGLPDNAFNHNGGTVRFGPDGMLYVSLGDDATGCPAQDLAVPVGKILRLDVRGIPDGPGAAPPIARLTPDTNPWATSPDSLARLVWTFGLRNPFRFQVDPQTGALFIGDVGENTWEELDWAPAGGLNMGWPFMEGPSNYTNCAITPAAPFTAPIDSYSHPTGHVAMPGPLYRVPAGSAARFPTEYDGNVFFYDYYIGFMRRLRPNGTGWSLASPVPGQPSADTWATGFDFVADMIETADGAIWYCRQNPGEIRRIRGTATVGVSPGMGSALTLAAPTPSPARGPVRIAWTQPAAEAVTLEVVDAQGRRVRTLLAGERREAGANAVTWDGADDAGRAAGAGIYFARLAAGGERRDARITRIR